MQDDESAVAMYCLFNMHMLPTDFLALDDRQKAFIIAAVSIRVEQEEEAKERARR